MPHMARDFDILDLKIGNRGFKMRIPVHQTLAAIDEALVVHIDKDLQHRVVETFVHREPVARPVTAGTKAFQLVDDGAAGLFFPFPDFFQKRLAAHFSAAGLLGAGKLALDHHLRGNPRMVLPGLPQRVMAAHPMPADQDILQRVVERVAHMQGTGDVRRRDHDAEGFSPRAGIRAGFERPGCLPFLRKRGFCRCGIEILVHRH